MKKVFNQVINMIAIILLLGILFAYAMFQGGFVSWFLFYSFLPILLYLLIFLLYPLSNWKVSRTFSRPVTLAGDDVTVTIHLKRSIPFPIYYVVFEETIADSLQKKYVKMDTYDYMNEPEKLLTQRVMKRVLFIGFKKQLTFSYTVDGLPRGEHLFSELHVKASDVLGFIKKEQLFPLTDYLQVRPRIRDINLPLSTGYADSGAKSTSSLLDNQTNVVTGVREYEPGDRFSWIHWKQSAKSNAMMTKEFEQERGTNRLLILDAHQVKKLNPLAFEATIELTLSFLALAERKKVDHNLLVMSEKIAQFKANHQNRTHENMYDYFMRLNPSGKSLAKSLQTHHQMLAEHKLIILVTSTLETDLLIILKQLQKQKQIILFYVAATSMLDEVAIESIGQLRANGIQVYEFTERELRATTIEVKR